MNNTFTYIGKKILLMCIATIYMCTCFYANAIDCDPPFNGNWTITSDCTYPGGGIKVYGDITVNPGVTVKVPGGVTLGINLASNKVTFGSDAMILFEGTGKMDNTVSNRNTISVSYSASSGTVGCPSGYSVLNTAGTAFQGGTETSVAASGTIQCGSL